MSLILGNNFWKKKGMKISVKTTLKSLFFFTERSETNMYGVNNKNCHPDVMQQ